MEESRLAKPEARRFTDGRLFRAVMSAGSRSGVELDYGESQLQWLDRVSDAFASCHNRSALDSTWPARKRRSASDASVLLWLENLAGSLGSPVLNDSYWVYKSCIPFNVVGVHAQTCHCIRSLLVPTTLILCLLKAGF